METSLKLGRGGTVKLPTRLRKALGMKGGDQFLAEVRPEGLLLRPVGLLPAEMYSDVRVAEFATAEAELGSAMRLRGRRG